MYADEVASGRSLFAAALCALGLMLANAPLASGQGVENQEAVDRIIGSEVQEEEAAAAAEPDRVIAAIDKTAENTELVRKLSNLETMDIVFLSDAAQTEGGPPPEIEARLEANKEGIEELRKEIEGNAMVYHAINSRQILPRDVLAVEFEEPGRLVIFAAAKPPAR